MTTFQTCECPSPRSRRYGLRKQALSARARSPVGKLQTQRLSQCRPGVSRQITTANFTTASTSAGL
eukprot:1227996-Lingulodinium_polyedra.AAC.1